MGILYDRVQNWHLQVIPLGLRTSIQDASGKPDTTCASTLWATPELSYANSLAKAISKSCHLGELPDYLSARTYLYVAERAVAQENEKKLLPLPPQGMKDLELVFRQYAEHVFAPSEEAFHTRVAEHERKTILRNGVRDDFDASLLAAISRLDSAPYLLAMNTFITQAVVLERSGHAGHTRHTDPTELSRTLHHQRIMPKLEELSMCSDQGANVWKACRDAYINVLLKAA